jgi:hypothetical protein
MMGADWQQNRTARDKLLIAWINWGGDKRPPTRLAITYQEEGRSSKTGMNHDRTPFQRLAFFGWLVF